MRKRIHRITLNWKGQRKITLYAYGVKEEIEGNMSLMIALGASYKVEPLKWWEWK